MHFQGEEFVSDHLPLVSVLINNYNYGRFLHEAVDSVLNQTYSNIEVIVVDDGSTDNSQAVIASYGDCLTPILKKNGGQASAFNAGFSTSQGKIICFLDSDDAFLPNKVETVVETFRSFLEAGWCFHPLTLVNENAEALTKSNYQDSSGEFEYLTKRNQINSSFEHDFRADIQWGKLKHKFPFRTATSGMCFRRSLLQSILPVPEIIKITSDRYLQIMALVSSKGFTLGKELAHQRIHGNNAYTLKEEDKHRLAAKISILTAFWVKHKQPSLFRFTNNEFGMGLGLYWCAGGVEAECRELVEKYLSSVTLLERFIINLKALYYYLKWKQW